MFWFILPSIPAQQHSRQDTRFVTELQIGVHQLKNESLTDYTGMEVYIQVLLWTFLHPGKYLGLLPLSLKLAKSSTTISVVPLALPGELP